MAERQNPKNIGVSFWSPGFDIHNVPGGEGAMIDSFPNPLGRDPPSRGQKVASRATCLTIHDTPASHQTVLRNSDTESPNADARALMVRRHTSFFPSSRSDT